MGKHFNEFLYWENKPNTRTYQLHRCLAILEMQAKFKDRMMQIKEDSIKFYGIQGDKIKTTKEDSKRYHNYKRCVELLDRYYNASVGMLKI